MKTKLFLAFFVVIIVALISNFIYESFIVSDFDDYVSGTKEDKLYWILAAIEGSYREGSWKKEPLHNAVHWALMLGFDVKILDATGGEVLNSKTVVSDLPPSIKRRMEGIIDINTVQGAFESYPLYLEGKEIGTMMTRPFKRFGSIDEKENIFKERGKEFLIISFIIAGGGAALLAMFFILFLSRPLNKMKKAVESMAQGDFSVRLQTGSRDEIGKLAVSFNFMAEALQREEALRKHLTSNVAHELRTPLAVMKANIEAILDGVVKDSNEGLENIRLEVEKLIRLVKGIEDVTKAEASFFSGKDYADINLSTFLSRILTKVAPLATEKGIEMKLVSRNDANVTTDPAKLETILQNILTNAIKNTKEGGVWIDYGTENKNYFVKVTDSGSGIPEDQKQLIFKRFYRGDDSQGIGLGLSIVKELIDVMDGDIDLKSTLNEGSTFTVWLPNTKK